MPWFTVSQTPSLDKAEGTFQGVKCFPYSLALHPLNSHIKKRLSPFYGLGSETQMGQVACPTSHRWAVEDPDSSSQWPRAQGGQPGQGNVGDPLLGVSMGDGHGFPSLGPESSGPRARPCPHGEAVAIQPSWISLHLPPTGTAWEVTRT